MESFVVSTVVVALAEIGDKTQLLALVLTSRFRRPAPIIAGILIATVANHAFAAVIGAWIAEILTPMVLRWILGLGFLGFALWALIPDRLDDEDKPRNGFGPFLTTVIVFFLVEMGDKTQVATVALAAQFPQLVWVVAGTSLGMLIANVPVVLLGQKAAERLPTRLIRWITAGIFALLGILALAGIGISGN